MAGHALIIGESLIDEVHSADGDIAVHPGGSPMNVAIGLGRLDRDVELVTQVGDDDFGRLVEAHVRASSVELAPGAFTGDRTSVATAYLDADGAATYDFALTWDISAVTASPDPLVVHTGSIAAVVAPGAAQVRQVLKDLRPHATVTYDPNARPALMGDPALARGDIEAIVELADVVKVSDEDIAWLEPNESIDDVMASWARSGPALVVVTHGSRGARAITVSGDWIEVAAPRVTVADTVGAGDSFMAGLIDGLWSAGLLGGTRRDALAAIPADTVARVLDRCVEIAAITVSRQGANPPTSAELR